MKAWMRYSINILLSITLLIGQFGCAAFKPYTLPSEEVRAQLGTIGVVSARFKPDAAFQLPAKGTAAGAGRGATSGVSAALSSPYTLIFLPSVLVLSGLIGAVYGAATAESSEKVTEAETALKKCPAELKIQELIRDSFLVIARKETNHSFVLIEGEGPTTPDEQVSYTGLAAKGINTVVELSLLRFGLEDQSINSPLMFYMTVRTRLIRTADGKVLHESTVGYRSAKRRKLIAWAENNAQPFREEFERAYQVHTKRVVASLFLLYDLPVDRPLVTDTISQSTTGSWSYWSYETGIESVEVDSLQPTLQWEPFPRPQHLKADKQGMLGQVSKVTYDFMVLGLEKDSRFSVVYSREGLPEPCHKIEAPLEPCTKYYWQVRARFEINNQPRVTKWELSEIPFIRTPCSKTPRGDSK